MKTDDETEKKIKKERLEHDEKRKQRQSIIDGENSLVYVAVVFVVIIIVLALIYMVALT